VHRPLEFLCGLLEEQPMGFYPPDALVHEAQRRGIAVLPPDVNRSGVSCTIEGPAPDAARLALAAELTGAGAASSPVPAEARALVAAGPAALPPGLGAGTAARPEAVTPAAQHVWAAAPGAPSAPNPAVLADQGAIRIGLGYVVGVKADEVAALVAAREEGGPFRAVGDLASRAGAGRPALEQLAWSGACDALAGGDRRVALWELGVAAPGRRVDGGVQLSLPLDVPAAPALAELGPWDAMVADYATTGVSARVHPLGLLRDDLARRGAVSTAGLTPLRHRAPVRIGGFVVARQRPGTAKGVCFLLLEDEFGTVNVVVPPNVYERDRLAVRSEPLVIVTGRVEKYAALGGAVNVVVDRVEPLDTPNRVTAEVKELGKNYAIVGGDRLPDVARGPYGLDELELARRQREAAEREEREAAEQRAAAAGGGGGDFRAVAPPVMSFTQGRRR
jgi:error-prone DNA polymerase